MSTISQQRPGSFGGYDAHQDHSSQAQKRADKWMISGTVLMGTGILGIIGLPLFLRGLVLQVNAARAGMDLVANQTLINRFITAGWGAVFDGGYFWHYNELLVGGTGAPGEKAWQISLILVVFCGRMAAGIGLLQMKRWGQQWLVVFCWMGLIVWIGYNINMTIYGDVRYANITFPVWGWWLYDIFYITPFLAIPYLHTVNREIFTD